jgi:hypothetical protein
VEIAAGVWKSQREPLIFTANAEKATENPKNPCPIGTKSGKLQKTRRLTRLILPRR